MERFLLQFCAGEWNLTGAFFKICFSMVRRRSCQLAAIASDLLHANLAAIRNSSLCPFRHLRPRNTGRKAARHRPHCHRPRSNTPCGAAPPATAATPAARSRVDARLVLCRARAAYILARWPVPPPPCTCAIGSSSSWSPPSPPARRPVALAAVRQHKGGRYMIYRPGWTIFHLPSTLEYMKAVRLGSCSRD